jgi:N-acetylglucosaminyl-diphospho-decaprenol L-rhamnosyltransferase
MLSNQISIVINAFKSESKIINCLNSISNIYKIIVVENSSNISFKKEIENKYANVECHLTGQNLGYAKGNNFGLSKVLTPYALIINPDTVLNKDAIENFIITAKKIKNDFAMIGPSIQDEKNLNNNVTKFTEVEFLKGFAIFLNIEQFKDIGFFDEKFFIYLEEIDLCKRLRVKNKKIYLDPTIIIYHQGGSSHNEEHNFEMELSRNWHWMWSNFYYTKKYKGIFLAFILNSKKFISSLIKFAYYTLTKNKIRKLIYKQRFLGLLNAMLGRTSWYRPYFNK